MAFGYAAIYFFTSNQFQILAVLVTLILLTAKLFKLNRKYSLEKLRNRFLYNIVITFNVLLLATIFNAISEIYAAFSTITAALYLLTSILLFYVILKRRKMNLRQFFK